VHIIFGTRFSDYVFDSINCYACDYMLKPFDSNRIIKTIERIYNLKDPSYINDRFCIKSDRNIYYVKYDDIYIFEKYGKRLSVVTKRRIYECYESLSEIEKLLKGRLNFARVHKSYIVNLDKVKTISKKFTSYEIIFNDIDNKAILSRDKHHVLNELKVFK
jgi:DNA-binding LytR/AlgR family response regulator